jgi:Uma2 family endonuclease
MPASRTRVWAALERAIRQAGLDCEALGDGIAIEVDDETDYEPDALVNCGPRLGQDEIAANNPVIVVEVLSPSAQSIDSGDKLADYFRVPSIQHYLIGRSKRREIIHHARSGNHIVSRTIDTGSIYMDPPGISIAVAEVYAGTG